MIGQYMAPLVFECAVKISSCLPTSILLTRDKKSTCAVPPGNVPRHYIAPSMCTIRIHVDVCVQVELTLEVRVAEHCRDDSFWVAIPDFIRLLPPGQCIFANVLGDYCFQALPGNVTEHRRINKCMQILLVMEQRWGIELRCRLCCAA